MYGITASGNSVMVHIHNFLPYLYVEVSSGEDQISEKTLTDIKDLINRMMP